LAASKICAVQVPDANVGRGRHLHCPPSHFASSDGSHDLSLPLQMLSCEQLKSGRSLHKHLSPSQTASCPSEQSNLLPHSSLFLQLRSGGAAASSQTHCLFLQVGVPLLPGPPPAQKARGQSLCSLHDPGARAGRGFSSDSSDSSGLSSLESPSGLSESPESIAQPSCRFVAPPALKTCESLGDQESDLSSPGAKSQETS